MDTAHAEGRMPNTKDSVSSGYPNTEKRVENATRSVSGLCLTNNFNGKSILTLFVTKSTSDWDFEHE